MKQCLEKMYPVAKGIGCTIPGKKLGSEQVASLLRNDLSEAKRLSDGDKTGFFRRKAQMIEERLEKSGLQQEEAVVGFGPGLKYVYPGLPLGFAKNVDPAIRELIDLIASCRLVAMSGFCCSGHPSSIINNPYLDDALEDPKFAAMHRHKHGFETGLITYNKSPYLFLLLFGGPEGSCLQKALGDIHSETNIPGIMRMSISSSIDFNFMGSVSGFLRMPIRGEPGLQFLRPEASHEEVARAYCMALAGFWNKLRTLFMQITNRKIPEIGPQQFDSGSRDWDREYALINERRGNGFRLPNYCYFDGKKLVGPGFPEKKTGTNGL